MLRLPAIGITLVAIAVGAWACGGAVAAPAGNLENPYKNAKVGEWAKYHQVKQGGYSVFGGGFEQSSTVVANDGETVRIAEKAVGMNDRTHESEKTVSLREPFTLTQLLQFPGDARIEIVERSRTSETVSVGSREIATTHISYDIEPNGFSPGQREIWVADGVPLGGLVKIRTVTPTFTWVLELVAFGFAGDAPVTGPQPPVERKSHSTKNSLGQTLVLIPKGEFLMGAVPFHQFAMASLDLAREEKLDLIGRKPPQHPEVISRDFWMSAHEVTVGQFRQFVEATGYKTDAEQSSRGGTGLLASGKWGKDPRFTWKSCGLPLTDQHPVVNVSWNDAKAFCDWLSRQEKKRYRLPTEAEWEYACRAGTTTAYSTGEDAKSLFGYANVADRSLHSKEPGMPWSLDYDDGYPYQAPVGSFKANAFGLYDMHGNALEWCGDRFNFADPLKPHLGPMPPPAAPPGGPVMYVLRGGNWFNDPKLATSASRSGAPAEHCMSLIGYRVVAENDEVSHAVISAR